MHPADLRYEMDVYIQNACDSTRALSFESAIYPREMYLVCTCRATARARRVGRVWRLWRLGRLGPVPECRVRALRSLHSWLRA